ncbi:MAG: flagellar biosynthetic protein FliP, partial [Ignavibacteria bacterium]|nr:flagellar biosynthetic protein FliP [Ignavibacteria bacterium]
MHKKLIPVVLLVLLVGGAALAQDKGLPVPKLSVEVGKATKPEDVSVTLQILFLMTILSLAPAIL